MEENRGIVAICNNRRNLQQEGWVPPAVSGAVERGSQDTCRADGGPGREPAQVSI